MTRHERGPRPARLGLLAVCLTLALALAFASGARAATCDFTWGGAANADWMTASNWQGGVVPTVNSNVCINSGSPVLEQTGANSPALGSLTIGGSAGLTVSIHQVLVSASTTIAPSASLTLNGTYNGANAGNASLGGGPVLNQGTITLEGTGYDATLYGAVTNDGTVNVPYGSQSIGQGGNGGTGSFVNDGTVDIAAPNPAYPNNPASLAVIGAPFTNAAGTITDSGSFTIAGASGTTGAFSQGAGTITGNPVELERSSSLAFTGAGAGAFTTGDSVGSLPMSGNLAAGQSLTVNIGTGLEEAGSFSSAGAITLDGDYPGCCGGSAGIITDSGTFTNTGSILVTSNDVTGALTGNVVNDGTITVTPTAELEQTSGGFTNAGTLVPEISSANAGEFAFDSGATFTAGGTLAPALESGFVPAVGQSFKVVAGSGVSGRFAAVGGGFGANYAQAGQIDAVYGVASSVPVPTSPAPTPAPASAKAHVGALTGGRGIVTARLTCPSGGAACARITVRATASERVGRHHTKLVTVAAGSLAGLASGGAKTVTLALNRAGRALAHRDHGLTVHVTIREGTTTLRRTTVHVRAPGRAAKQKHR